MSWGRCKKCGLQLEVLVQVPTCKQCDWGDGPQTTGEEHGPYFVVMTDDYYRRCLQNEIMECIVYEDEDEAVDYADMLGDWWDVHVIMTFERPPFEFMQDYCGTVSAVMYQVHNVKPIDDDSNTLSFIQGWLIGD